jgi:predicted RNA-binding Zn-ribbon protein involved in translation (DUF1610 family)
MHVRSWGSEDGARLPVAQQRGMLATILNQQLALLPGAPAWWVTWRDSSTPPIEFESGWGFIRAVWMQVAQMIPGVKSVYICDDCGRVYRRKRKAKIGQRQYCPDCGDKGAKRRWWRHHKSNAGA